MADDASSNVNDAVIVVFQLEGLASEAHHCAVFTVKNLEFTLSCYRVKKKIHVEAVTSANAANTALGMFRQLSILDRENIIRSVNKIEESAHSVQAVVKAKQAVCQDRYLFSVLLQARTNEKCYDLKSRYTIPRNILTPVMLKPKLNHPTLFPGTAQGPYPTPTVSNLVDDVFIVAIQLDGPEAKSHYRTDLIIQNTRFTFCCYKKKVTAQVEVTAGANTTDSAFGMFRRYYILDSNNKVLSVRKFEETSNSLKAFVNLADVLSMGRYMFKIVLQVKANKRYHSVESHYTFIYTRHGGYTAPIPVILKPDGEPEYPESLPVPTPILAPLPDSHTTAAPTSTGLELSRPTPPSSESDQQPSPISISSDSGCEAKADTAPASTNLELPQSPPLSIENDQQSIPTLISPDSGCDAKAGTTPTSANLELPRSPPLSIENDQESIPMSISSDLSYEPEADLPLDMVEDYPFDVHFFHCDQTRRVNVIGAHKKKILEVSPKLHLFVTKTEAARDVLAADMNFISHNDLPVTVDISYLSLSAFRAVMVYIYTRSIETIFSNVSAVAITSSSVNAEYNSSQNGRTEVRDDLTVLYMDQVLYLAQRFDVTDLVEAFTRLTLFSTKLDDVIEILVQNADNAEFESIAMGLIKSHFHEIFGGYASNEIFEKFRDRLLCDGLKSKIMGMMMMRTVEETKFPSLDPPE